jgi:hypothetical protein
MLKQAAARQGALDVLDMRVRTQPGTRWLYTAGSEPVAWAHFIGDTIALPGAASICTTAFHLL